MTISGKKLSRYDHFQKVKKKLSRYDQAYGRRAALHHRSIKGNKNPVTTTLGNTLLSAQLPPAAANTQRNAAKPNKNPGQQRTRKAISKTAHQQGPSRRRATTTFPTRFAAGPPGESTTKHQN
jgi:hypothetical protein